MSRRMRGFTLAALILLITALAGMLPVAARHYDRQYRDAPAVRPSARFLLGTDDLGRDRLARLVLGSGISLGLAPAAALLSVAIAAMVGGAAGFLGGWADRALAAATDLFLSLPWLFLLISVRAWLPLNVSPWASVLITFLLLGLLGWPATARVVRACAASLRNSDLLLQARACGCRGLRLFLIHVLPNLGPVLHAQFWIAVPVFILAEANLGMLGLGVAEPLPSWGNLLRELEDYHGAISRPERLAPLGLLVVVMSLFQLLFEREDFSA